MHLCTTEPLLAQLLAVALQQHTSTPNPRTSTAIAAPSAPTRRRELLHSQVRICATRVTRQQRSQRCSSRRKSQSARATFTVNRERTKLKLSVQAATLRVQVRKLKSHSDDANLSHSPTPRAVTVSSVVRDVEAPRERCVEHCCDQSTPVMPLPMPPFHTCGRVQSLPPGQKNPSVGMGRGHSALHASHSRCAAFCVEVCNQHPVTPCTKC